MTDNHQQNFDWDQTLQELLGSEKTTFQYDFWGNRELLYDEPIYIPQGENVIRYVEEEMVVPVMGLVSYKQLWHLVHTMHEFEMYTEKLGFSAEQRNSYNEIIRRQLDALKPLAEEFLYCHQHLGNSKLFSIVISSIWNPNIDTESFE